MISGAAEEGVHLLVAGFERRHPTGAQGAAEETGISVFYQKK